MGCWVCGRLFVWLGRFVLSALVPAVLLVGPVLGGPAVSRGEGGRQLCRHSGSSAACKHMPMVELLGCICVCKTRGVCVAVCRG